MNNILELNKDINAFNDNELLEAFNTEKPPFGRLNYFPVFASRIKKFKDVIFDEAISEDNNSDQFGMMKATWYIAISTLDYCVDEVILKEFSKHLKENWTTENYNLFINYIKPEKRFIQYFD